MELSYKGLEIQEWEWREVKAGGANSWVTKERTEERLSVFLEWLLRTKSKGPGAEREEDSS